MKVIEALGIKDEVLKRTTLANDGVETVRLVLEGKADIGVSQSSEILQGNREAFSGPFPKEFALATDSSLWRRNTQDFVAVPTGPACRGKLVRKELCLPPPAESRTHAR